MKGSLLFTAAFLGLSLAAGCAASADPASSGNAGVGGDDDAGGTGDDDGATSDPGDDAGAATVDGSPASKDGGASSKTDGGQSADAGPPAPGGSGLTISVNGETYDDPYAYIRRSSYVSGPSAGTFSGVSYVNTPTAKLQMGYLVGFDLNSGGDGYAPTGDYPCGAQHGSQTPLHGSYVSLITPSTGYRALAGSCTVHIDSAAPKSGGTGWRITGTVTGTLVDANDAPFPVSGSFDLGYEN